MLQAGGLWQVMWGEAGPMDGWMDGMGWDGMGWDGMGWDGMGWDGMGWDGMGWDGMGWDGMGLEGNKANISRNECDDEIVHL